MNRSFFSIAAALGAVLIAAPVIADEAPPVRRVQRAAPVREAPVRQAAAPAQAQPNWTGSQVGGQGGVAQMAQGFAEPGAYLFPDGCGDGLCQETPFSFPGHKTGGTGGGFLGYRVQFGSAVLGIETDINGKSLSTSHAFADSNVFRTEYFTGSVKESWDGSVRGRAGFLVTPWTLVYGTGGVAYGGISGSFSYSAQELGSFSGCISTSCASTVGGGSWSTTRVGATGGLGIETMFTNYLSLRLEWRYTDFGRFTETVPLRTFCNGACALPSSAASVELHPTFQTVMVGIGYNF